MAKKKEFQGEKISENITFCTDGKYRWQYDVNLFKNPTIFLLVWKIFFFITLGIFSIAIIHDSISWRTRLREQLLYDLRFFAYFLIGMTVVVVLGYLLYAAIMGGKYCIIFEMDENGINHKQIPEQAKKAKKISKATMLAGAASGNFTTIGVGMNAARTEMYSDFSRVRKVKAYPRRDLIKVNCRLSHNQVYAHKKDFEFIRGYITTHCPNLKH